MARKDPVADQRELRSLRMHFETPAGCDCNDDNFNNFLCRLLDDDVLANRIRAILEPLAFMHIASTQFLARMAQAVAAIADDVNCPFTTDNPRPPSVKDWLPEPAWYSI